MRIQRVTRRVPVAWGPFVVIVALAISLTWWVDELLFQEVVGTLERLFDAVMEGLRRGLFWMPMRPGG